MGIYSISDLSELTGVKTHTLRVWEKRYGLLRPQRTDTNIRYYEDRDLNMLKLVQRLNHSGVRISRIAEMSIEEMEKECRQISLQREDFEGKLEQGMVDMDVTTTDAILDSSIRQHGFEATVKTLLIPFLEKMEVMWLSGNIDEAHETCFRELVKRKAIREIDKLPPNCSGPRVMMLLPPGNQQEMSHLFMHYFLRKAGLCVTDMGCDVNLECASQAVKNSSTECILIVNSDPVHWQFESFIKDLAKRTGIPILVSGRAALEEWQIDNGNVIMLDGMEETISFACRLQENLRNHMS